jgi:group I intron endonuclease
MKIPDELLHKSRIKISGVYKIVNNINGKFYIGSSNHLYIRYSTHVKELNRNNHSNQKLQNSWNKYGESNFSFLVLEYCRSEEIFEKEQKYINSLNPELNIAKIVGYPNTPKAGSPEAMARSKKNLEARKNSEWYNSKELRNIMSEKLKVRWANKEYRKSRSEETKSLWKNENYRIKLSEIHKKVKDADRLLIKKLRESGVMVKDLMARFGVERKTIYRIVREA